MSIVLHIERLVVDEALVRGERRADLLAEIEHALAQRLAKDDAPLSLRAIGAVANLPVQALPPQTPTYRSLGTRIAAGVGEALHMPVARRS